MPKKLVANPGFSIQKTALVLSILAILLGSFLRFWQYGQFPIYGETGDEWAWVWQGSSLIKTGVPTSWSFFKSYQPNFQLTFPQNEGPLVKPSLDHPPLFGLFAGITHALESPDWQQKPSVKVIRLPMVMLGIVNLILLAFLAHKIWRDQPLVASLAVCLYATIPTAVFGSRLVVAENLLITWQFIVWILSLHGQSRWRSGLLTIIGAAAILTKVAGITIPASLIGFGIWKKDKSLVLAGVSGLAIGVAIWLGYAAFYNWGLFLAVQAEQSLRDVGMSTLAIRFFLHPSLIKHFFVDGWMLIGVVTFFMLLGKKARHSGMDLILTSGLVSFFFIILSSGERTYHGWYTFQLIPVFVICCTQWLQTVFDEENWWQFALGWVFMLPTIRMALSYLDYLSHLPTTGVRIIDGLGALPLGTSFVFPRLTRFVAILCFLLMMIANCAAIISVKDVQYWTDQDFYSKY